MCIVEFYTFVTISPGHVTLVCPRRRDCALRGSSEFEAFLFSGLSLTQVEMCFSVLAGRRSLGLPTPLGGGIGRIIEQVFPFVSQRISQVWPVLQLLIFIQFLGFLLFI